MSSSVDSSMDSVNTSTPVSNSLVWATWALFAGLTLMLIGGGMIATLIGVRAELDGFADLQIGAIAAAYYAGFLVGSRITLAQLGNVGHIRVYAALASVLAASTIAAGLNADPYLWIALRFVAGACFAGQYVVAESWLNELASNENRGRILSLVQPDDGRCLRHRAVLVHPTRSRWRSPGSRSRRS